MGFVIHAMILLTRHAVKRARSRLGWPKSATERMAQRAFAEGHELVSLDDIRRVEYNGVCYVFSPDRALLTVFQLGSGRLSMEGLHQ